MLVATSAEAADLPPIAAAPAPPPPPMASPAFSWAGPYVGISGYAIWCGPTVACVPTVAYGAMLTAGYNATFGAFVVGAEASANFLFSIGTALLVEANARAGYAVADRVLLYGEAGVGYNLTFPGTYFTFGGGAEIALGDALSVFAEFKPTAYFGGGNPLFRRASLGINFHFGR